MRQVALVVVGAGPGGCAAAVQATRLGVKPILLDSAGRAGGLLENARKVENYPGLEGPVSGPVFVRRLQEHLERFGLGVEQGRVDSLEGAEGGGYLLGGSFGALRARSVILSVGTAARPLGVPGEGALAGFKLFYEVKHLLPRPPARVLVVGGGEAAFDYSLNLAGAGAHVEMCIRSTRPAARGRLLEQVVSEARISRRMHTELLELAGGPEGVLATVRSPEGQQVLRADAVLVAAGRTSAAGGLVEGLEGAPGLYLIGDARRGALGQAGMAVGDGLSAAAAAVDYLDGEA